MEDLDKKEEDEPMSSEQKENLNESSVIDQNSKQSDTVSLEEIHNPKFDEKCQDLESLNQKLHNEYCLLYNEKSGEKYINQLKGFFIVGLDDVC